MNEPLTLEARLSAMAEIAEQIKTCQKCGLAKERTHAVPGDGPITAEVMFIGEGPGFNEDKQGLPFVGNSGKLLVELLASIGMKRDQVFITNVVRCRPPENRDPLPDEVDTCTKAYLYRQIDLINPKIVATLGRFSMGLFFPNAKITQVHGQPKKVDGRYYLPLFHPSFVLRDIQKLRPQAEADIRKILDLLAESAQQAPPIPPAPVITAPPDAPAGDPPGQLTLF